MGRIRGKSGARPKRNGKATARAKTFPGLKGWKVRQAEYTLKNGIVTLASRQSNPFLAVATRISKPAEVVLRIRSAKGGAGRVDWIVKGSKTRSSPFRLRPSDWNETVVAIPGDDSRGILRIFLPAQAQAVEVDWIELRSNADKPRRWDF